MCFNFTCLLPIANAILQPVCKQVGVMAVVTGMENNYYRQFIVWTGGGNVIQIGSCRWGQVYSRPTIKINLAAKTYHSHRKIYNFFTAVEMIIAASLYYEPVVEMKQKQAVVGGARCIHDPTMKINLTAKTYHLHRKIYNFIFYMKLKEIKDKLYIKLQSSMRLKTLQLTNFSFEIIYITEYI